MCAGLPIPLHVHKLTVMSADFDGMPSATTTILLAPVSLPDGTSKRVDTDLLPVFTAIVLWS